MILAIITLISGLAISSVAIYYSVIGLAAIFAASVVPIMIMGGILETSKLVAAWWLKANWSRAPFFLKSYMLIAVLVLMIITSLGIFGFLSKAHVEQGVPTGNIISQVESIGQQIELENQIIEQSKKDIGILNQQIERYTELGAVTRGVEARKTQEDERNYLNTTIQNSQTTISNLMRDRLELSNQLRSVEAELGPVKYIAQLIYGDNPDAALLEKAVVWVIITLVFVFDPLAILLLLAAQLSFRWHKDEKILLLKEKENYEHNNILYEKVTEPEKAPEPETLPDETPGPAETTQPEDETKPQAVEHHDEAFIDWITRHDDHREEEFVDWWAPAPAPEEEPPAEEKEPVIAHAADSHPYLTAGFGTVPNFVPMMYRPEEPPAELEEELGEKIQEMVEQQTIAENHLTPTEEEAILDIIAVLDVGHQIEEPSDAPSEEGKDTPPLDQPLETDQKNDLYIETNNVEIENEDVPTSSIVPEEVPAIEEEVKKKLDRIHWIERVSGQQVTRTID